jgi:hypothetical protein
LSETKAASLLPEKVQAFFLQLVERGVYTFTARVDEKGVTYPEVAQVFPNLKEEQIESFLDKLRNNGLLDARLLDKVSICPECGGTKSYPKYYCPRCASVDVGRASIVEHFRCGYIGSEENFRQGNEIICPRCKSELRDVDFRRIGTAFECKSCHTRFESPRVSSKCSSCGNVYTFREAKYVSIYSYKISDAAKQMIAKESLQLAPVVSHLKNRGFDVSLEQRVKGKSGAYHNFRLVARNGNFSILSDFAFEADENAIIRLFAKKYDLNPTLSLLITFAEPTSADEKIGLIYGVNIVTLKNGSRMIEEQLDKLIGAIGKEKPTTVMEAQIAPSTPKVEQATTRIEEKEEIAEIADSSESIFFEDEEPESIEL